MEQERKKRIFDLLLLLTGIALLLTSLFLPDGLLCWITALFGIAFLSIGFSLTARDRGNSQNNDFAYPRTQKAEITEAVLLNEEDGVVASWLLHEKTSAVIGREAGENQVDINLNGSAYAAMVEVEHAVLNYTGGAWYVEDLSSKNGTSVQPRADGRKYKLAAGQPCRLHNGDILHIGLARLMLR